MDYKEIGYIHGADGIPAQFPENKLYMIGYAEGLESQRWSAPTRYDR